MNTNKIWCSMMILSCSLWASAGSISLVDWSGQYVPSSRNLELPSGTDNGGTRTFEFSADNPVSTSPLAGYEAPTGKSDLFYGVLQNHQTNGTPANFAANQVALGDTNSTIRIQGGAGDSTISGMIFFQKSGFLNGFDSETVSLNQVDASFNISDHSATSTTFRFAVQNGTDWYLSEAAYTTNGNGSFAQEDLSIINWGSWDPTGAPINSAPLDFSFSGSTLNDVQSFGFYFNLERENNTPRFRVDSYSVMVIPEPGTLALVGIALGSLLLFRRRR